MTQELRFIFRGWGGGGGLGEHYETYDGGGYTRSRVVDDKKRR
jgi:hypothetical protein